MRYAIVSDIHANWQAWSAVRDDIYHQGGVDCILCLGDVVGYGPQPRRVFEDVLDYCGNFVLGNHDAVVCGKLDPALFNDNARYIIDWTCQQLGDDVADHFYHTPMTMGDADLYCAHAEAANPEAWGYIFEAEHARSSFELTDAELMFVGHTHRPLVARWSGVRPESLPVDEMVFLPNYRYLVNVGSVGDPRDGDPTACYVIYDADELRLQFRRLPFDYDAFQQDLAATQLPVRPFFLDCLATNRRSNAADPLADMALAELPQAQAVTAKTRVSTNTVQIKHGTRSIKAAPAAVRAGSRTQNRPQKRLKAARAPRSETTQVAIQEHAEQQKKTKTAIIIGSIVTLLLVIGIAVALTVFTKPPAKVAGAGGGAADPDPTPTTGAVASGSTTTGTATTGTAPAPPEGTGTKPTEIKRGELTAEQRAAINAQMQASAGKTQTQTATAPVATAPHGKGVKGRYLRISIPGKDKILTLMEVQVFANKQNIAQGKKAAQSSDYGNSTADRAVDGNTDGKYTNTQGAHTDTQSDPWWEIDLGKMTTVHGVSIFNRTDCCGDRLDGYQVALLDEQRNTVWSKKDLPTPKTRIGIPVDGPTAETQAPAPKPLAGATADGALPYALSPDDSRRLDMGARNLIVFARFKTTSKADGTLIAKSNGTRTSACKILKVTNGGTLMWDVHSAGALSGGKALNDGQWHNVMVRYGPSKVKIFIDGELKADRSLKRIPDLDDFVVSIGDGPAGRFNGQLAEVAVLHTTWQEAKCKSVTASGTLTDTPSFRWKSKDVTTPDPVAAKDPDPPPATPQPAANEEEYNDSDLLAYESFNYGDGELIEGKNGGRGWAGPWKHIRSGKAKIAADSLAASGPSSGLPVAGGKAAVKKDSRCGRMLDTSKDGPFGKAGLLSTQGKVGAIGKSIYLSVLLKPDAPGKRFWEFELHEDDLDDNGRVGGVGKEHERPPAFLRSGGKNDIAIGDKMAPGANFYVMRIDFQNGNEKVHVYQNPSRKSEPAKPDATGSHGQMDFNGISLGVFVHSQTVYFDEIRIGKTYKSVVGDSLPTGPLADVAKLIASKKFSDAAQAAADNDQLADLNRSFKMTTPLLKTFYDQRGKTVSVGLRRGTQTVTIKAVTKKGVSGTVRRGTTNTPISFSVDDLTAAEKLQRLGQDDKAAFYYVGMRELGIGNSKTAGKVFAESKTPFGKAVAAFLTEGSSNRAEENAEKALNLVLVNLRMKVEDGDYGKAINSAVSKEYSTTVRRNFPRLVNEYTQLYGETDFGRKYVASLKHLAQAVETGSQPGLMAHYYNNKEWKGAPELVRVEEKINFNWGNGKPAEEVNPDQFGIKFTGFVKPDKSGTYTIYGSGDDGISITFNGKKYPDNKAVDRNATVADVELKAGEQYPIEIRYHEHGGGASMKVEWSSKEVSRQVIPVANLATAGSKK
jgi:predicted phosphodiesterase